MPPRKKKTFSDRLHGSFARNGLNTILLDIRDGVTELGAKVANLERAGDDASASRRAMHEKIDQQGRQILGLKQTVDYIAPQVITLENERQQKIGQKNFIQACLGLLTKARAAGVAAFAGTLWLWAQWDNFKGFVGKLLRVLIFVAVITAMGSLALAHDHWIRDGKYMDPVTGHHCCDENDCKELSAAEVITATRNDDGSMSVQGFHFQRRQQHKSEDGKWYRCAHRCLFKPVEG
jgi:hypothetical protein